MPSKSPARQAARKPARPRIDRLTRRLRVPDYYQLARPKSDLIRLVKEHLSDVNPKKAFQLIQRAFDRATVHLLVIRGEEFGPNRKQLAQHIEHLSRKLVVALTSESTDNKNEPSTMPPPSDNELLHAWLVKLGAYRGTEHSPGELKRPRLGAVQFAMFSAVDHAQAATDAVAALAVLIRAAAQIKAAPNETDIATLPAKRGRPTNDALNILFSELMRSWELLMGKRPKLSVNSIGEVTCPFCIFFHHYFGGSDRRFKVRAIADRCQAITPAKEYLFSREATV
jgi:hypothetical protein